MGIFCGALGFIIEEKFMRNYSSLDPTLIVGCEGNSACLMWIVALSLFYFIPCKSDLFCDNGRLEDTYGAWEDYASNYKLVIQSIATVIIIPMSSFCGVQTTRNGTST